MVLIFACASFNFIVIDLLSKGTNCTYCAVQIIIYRVLSINLIVQKKFFCTISTFVRDLTITPTFFAPRLRNDFFIAHISVTKKLFYLFFSVSNFTTVWTFCIFTIWHHFTFFPARIFAVLLVCIFTIWHHFTPLFLIIFNQQFIYFSSAFTFAVNSSVCRHSIYVKPGIQAIKEFVIFIYILRI